MKKRLLCSLLLILTISFSKAQFAVNLPTANDHARFSSPYYAYTNQITVEAWVNFSAGNQPWAGQSTASVDNMATNVWLWHAGTFYVNDNGAWRSIAIPVQTGWNHMATVANASGLFIYINGSLVASNTTGITSSIKTNSLSIIDLGHDPRYPAGTAGRNTNTAFDEFRVWNVARTQTQIAATMTLCLTGSETNLVQYTKFDEGTGTSISSLTGSNATIINPSATNWIAGQSCMASLSSTSTQTNVSCNSACNGMASVAASGGVGPYTYTWTPSGGNSSSAAGLCSGNYTCLVSDALATIVINTFNITQPSIISATSTQTNNACNGDLTGIANMIAGGGTGPLTYSWSPSGGTSSNASGLAAGNYSCFITDANSCSITETVSITEPAAITVSATISNAGCAGQTNGSVVLIANGGTPSYTYLWSPAVSTTSAAASLGSGVYSATITDGNSCTSIQSYTLIAFALPSIGVATSNSLLCTGQTSTLNATGALTYTWSTSATGSSIVISPTVTTSYSVTGTDSNGCDNVATFTQSVSACTGVTMFENENSGVSLYPNPNTGIFTLSCGTMIANSTIEIIDVVGKLVYKKQHSLLSIEQIDISALKGGVYYLHLKNNETHVVKKLIKE